MIDWNGFNCPECKSTEIGVDFTRGEHVCSECGLVLEEKMIDYRPNLISKDKISDCQQKKKSQYGEKIERVLRKRSILSWKDKNLKIAEKFIFEIAEKLHLPGILINEVKKFYRIGLDSHLVEAWSIETIVAGSIYAASCEYQLSISQFELLKEINEKCFPLDKRHFNRAYGHLLEKIKIKPYKADLRKLITRSIALLSLSFDVERKSLLIVGSKFVQVYSQGKNPLGVVGAAIYISCKLLKYKITQQKIAESIGISVRSLQKHYTKLKSKFQAQQLYNPIFYTNEEDGVKTWV